jgi:thioredoxin-like negative regulator of GroEL
LKKVIIFTSIIVVLFGALALVTSLQNSQKAEGNKFKKSTLHPETLKQIDDPNYQNIILPEDLEQRLADGETMTVYFYSPTCPACRETSPIVVPLAEQMNIDLPMFNLLEFEDGWNDYGIESTPTIIHYIDGKEVDRIVGYQEESTFNSWFTDTVK